MTLLQLIDHLQKVFHDNGDVDMEVKALSPRGFPLEFETEYIEVDPEAKTITFT